ncbi:TP901-1 family phage major tail protein [Enterococcus sp. DIV0340]|uniref:phage major tail protein, TP901-1 family n=1 Tax=unclassified Enterococcus TaxID=2608891 RepID=UPI003D2FE4D7
MPLKKGIDVILLYRNLKKQSAEDAKTVTYQTEHTFGMSRNTDSTETKDGTVQTIGAIEYDFSSTALYERGSTTLKMLYDAFMRNETIEVWIIDKLDPQEEESNKFAAKYMQAFISSYEETASSEDDVEVSLEYAVQMIHQDGYATLTTEQQNAVQYAFTDTTKQAPKG